MNTQFGAHVKTIMKTIFSMFVVGMEDVFKSFCAFGAKGASPVMDGAKLAKMTRDLKLLGKTLTSIDIDIMFSKVKVKSEYVIVNFPLNLSCVNIDRIVFID